MRFSSFPREISMIAIYRALFGAAWCALLLFALGARAQENVPVILEITQANWQTLWDEVQAKPTHQNFEERTTTRVELPDERAIYWFTKPEHPAHPSIVKREVLEKPNGLDVRSRGWAGGAKGEFERWFVSFLEQDQRIRDKMYGREPQ
jgi:hypothetical protein